MSVGPAEILLIMIVALLVFGPQRLPEVGRQVGSALRELRKMQDAVRSELDMVMNPEHGTRPGDVASLEPDDHSTVDPGAQDLAPDETPPDDGRFSGPSDSFT